MIKAVIFDFDGIIVESSQIKTAAFRELFKGYPGKLEAIVKYHLKNAGISRFVKFRHIYERILGKNLAKGKEQDLGKRFSRIVFRKVLSAPFVPGAKEFLEANKEKYKFFIVSGTPEEELRKIIFGRGIEGYFQSAFGSPRDKVSIVKDIISKYGFRRNELVYVGDAESDRLAARSAGIYFIERGPCLSPRLSNHPCLIPDMTYLSRGLEAVELLGRRKERIK